MTTSSVLIVALINFLSAFLQATSGFGYAMIAMTLMPLVLPLQVCSAVSAVVVVVIAVQMVFSLRKHVKVSKVILPIVFCIITTNVGMYMLTNLEEKILRIILAVLIVGVTIQFMVFNKRKIVIKKSLRNDLIFGGITGLSTGMFNIVGPFFTIYFFSFSEDNLQFKANLEFSFLIAGLYSTFLHVRVGNINREVAPYLVASAIAAIIAGLLGLPLYKKLNRDMIVKIICIILPITALLLLIR